MEKKADPIIDEQPELISIKERLKNEFKDDPLFLACFREEATRDELFPDFLDQMSKDIKWHYAIKDITPWLKRRDSALRFYMNEFEDYINAFMVRNSYRLYYDDVYKLYLINLFVSKLDKTLGDAKAIIFQTGKLTPKKPSKGGRVPDEVIETVLVGLRHDAQNMRQDAADIFFHLVDSFRENKKNESIIKELTQELNTIQSKIKAVSIRMEGENVELKLQRKLVFKDLQEKKRRFIEKEKFDSLSFFKRLKAEPVIVEDHEVQVSTVDVENHKSVSEIRERIIELEQQLKQLDQEEKEVKHKLEKQSEISDLLLNEALGDAVNKIADYKNNNNEYLEVVSENEYTDK